MTDPYREYLARRHGTPLSGFPRSPEPENTHYCVECGPDFKFTTAGAMHFDMYDHTPCTIGFCPCGVFLPDVADGIGKHREGCDTLRPPSGPRSEETGAASEAMDYPQAARVIHLHLEEFCDESLAFPEMIADAARRAASALRASHERAARLATEHAKMEDGLIAIGSVLGMADDGYEILDDVEVAVAIIHDRLLPAESRAEKAERELARPRPQPVRTVTCRTCQREQPTDGMYRCFQCGGWFDETCMAKHLAATHNTGGSREASVLRDQLAAAESRATLMERERDDVRVYADKLFARILELEDAARSSPPEKGPET